MYKGAKSPQLDLAITRIKQVWKRYRGQERPRQDDRRKDRKRALEWHRMALKGVYTERRHQIRREEDRGRCRYDPWYTFYEFNPELLRERSRTGR